MDSERLQQLKQNPPDRSSTGFLTLLVEVVRAFLSLLFGNKHPGDFDAEFGSWVAPDFNLILGSSSPAPRPLINRDCDKTFLIYNFVSVPTERCTLPGQLAALQQAIDQVSQYLRNEFRCENPDCLQETGDLIWVGLDCETVSGPADQGAGRGAVSWPG